MRDDAQMIRIIAWTCLISTSIGCGDDATVPDAADLLDASQDVGDARDASSDAVATDSSTDATADVTIDARPEPAQRIWIGVDEIMELPMSGEGWDELRGVVESDWGTADVSDQDNDHDVATFGGALYAVRTGDEDVRGRVVEALQAAIGTEEGGRTLALGRQLLGYVVAADIIDYRDSEFVAWVDQARTRVLEGRAGIDTLLDSARRDPSNWGCHARASIMAAARYLDDDDQVAEITQRFHDYLGRSGDGFEFREDWWQADPSNPVGINPAGATLMGQNVDGVIPDDQRRGGMFEWPPPRENYVWESLQGTVATAHMIERAGYDPFEYQDRAILRAVTWLHDEPDYPAEGDDSWVPFRINAAYGTSFPTDASRPVGKSAGFTAWTHPG